MKNVGDTECNLRNAPSQVPTVKNMSPRVINSVVIPEGGLEYNIVTLLDRIYFKTTRAG